MSLNTERVTSILEGNNSGFIAPVSRFYLYLKKKSLLSDHNMSVKPKDDMLVGNRLNQTKKKRAHYKVCTVCLTQNQG